MHLSEVDLEYLNSLKNSPQVGRCTLAKRHCAFDYGFGHHFKERFMDN